MTKPATRSEQIVQKGLRDRLHEFRQLAESRNIKTIEQRDALILTIRLIETMLGEALTERAPTHHV